MGSMAPFSASPTPMPHVAALLIALVLFVGLPAQAQSLPDWAAPSVQSVEAGPTDGGLSSLVPCPPGQTNDGSGGCIPNPPTQVPIDGGLGLLALAGAGLAARRLGRREG